MATGVLILCLGQTTRLSPFLTDLKKSYLACIHLGISTNTLDAEGKITNISDSFPLKFNEVSKAVGNFIGEIEQIPPMFSARRISGKRLYSLARSGKEIFREPRSVHIYNIDIRRYTPPFLEVNVDCSKGTYIRSLADDIGKILGCGGHLNLLRRTAIGNVELAHCIPQNQLEFISKKDDLSRHLVSPNSALSQMPSFLLTKKQIQPFTNGNSVSEIQIDGQIESGCLVRVLDECGSLVGIGRWSGENNLVQPIRVFRK